VETYEPTKQEKRVDQTGRTKMATAEQTIWEVERKIEEAGNMGVDVDKVKAKLSEKWENEHKRTTEVSKNATGSRSN